jgi:hypothetical protein
VRAIVANVAMQILVADFGERPRPAGRDGHARIRGWMPHEPRYKICMVLAGVYFFFLNIIRLSGLSGRNFTIIVSPIFNESFSSDLLYVLPLK